MNIAAAILINVRNLVLMFPPNWFYRTNKDAPASLWKSCGQNQAIAKTVGTVSVNAPKITT
jgi:hypothetical protein